MSRKNRELVLGIDLGAKSTGVFAANVDASGNIESRFGATIVLDNSKHILGQSDRRAFRHTRRNVKRRKLAKRLFRVLLNEIGWEPKALIGERIKQNLEDFLMGLLNRRGYTYSDLRSNEDESTECSDFLKSYLEKKLGFPVSDLNEFKQALFSLGNTVEKVNESNFESLRIDLEDNFVEQKLLVKKPSIDIFKDPEFEKIFGVFQVGQIDTRKGKQPGLSEDHKQFIDGIKFLREAYEDYSIDRMGHVHRFNYIKNIESYIDKNWAQISQFLNTKNNKSLNLSSTTFSALVCNISNMQLRVLRKYFNKLEYSEQGDQYESDRFIKLYRRWITSWRVDDTDVEKKQARKELLAYLAVAIRDRKPAINVLLEINGMKTVPPYEDQDNRRPPKTKTLVLSLDALNTLYGKKWQSWVRSFEKLNVLVSADLHENTYGVGGLGIEAHKLQRVLDFTKVGFILNRSDSIDLQRLSVEFKKRPEDVRAKSPDYQILTKALAPALTRQDVESFLCLKCNYDQLREDLRRGSADLEDESSLLLVASGRRKHVDKVEVEIAAGVLSFPRLTQEALQDIRRFVENECLEDRPRKSVKGYLKEVSNAIKNEGVAYFVKPEDKESCKKLAKSLANKVLRKPDYKKAAQLFFIIAS